MNELRFGLDFGTTNSLAALVIGNEAIALTNEVDDKPHPSIVWYRGSEVVVGREARKHIESFEGGVVRGFIRSPKVALRREGPLHIEGRALEPVDVVSEVLGHIRKTVATRKDQDGRSYQISRAVMTIPVDFAGRQRRMLRSAARKAGIGVLQFVHEPVAALYAYLRTMPDFRRDLGRLENRIVLVFDWGGGTLDLTACRVLGGMVMQVASRGNNEVGGDRFDERIRNKIRDGHAAQYGISDISAVEQPGVIASLLTQCESAKIALSDRERFTVIIKDYLRSDGHARDLAVDLTRKDLEDLSGDLIRRGLADIDRLLDEARLDRSDIELCIATGGMVNMPAIWNGLVERFGSRVPVLSNRDRIIAEGAAWIAHDGLRLKLAKPIEVLVADGRPDRGAYLPLVDAGQTLPVENDIVAVDSRRFYCVDPRDGLAVFQFTKPRKVGPLQSDDERSILGSLNLAIDSTARPFLERLECEVQIDHDYIARVSLRSKLRGETADAEFHDLDFGLALPVDGTKPETPEGGGAGRQRPGSDASRKGLAARPARNVALRSNVSPDDDKSYDKKWVLVPGDVVESYVPNYFGAGTKRGSEFQRSEKMYYENCAYCKRTKYDIRQQGAIDACRYYGCGVNDEPVPRTNL